MNFWFLKLEETLEITYLTHSGGESTSPEGLCDLQLVTQPAGVNTRSELRLPTS